MPPSETYDTTRVTGQSGTEEYTQDIVEETKDTTGPMGEDVDSDYEGNLFPDQSGTRDTEAVQGGTHRLKQDDPAQHMDGTLDTQTGGGSPIQHAQPAYRVPKDYPVVTGTRDTTLTDQPLSDGSEPDESAKWQSQTFDTINQKVTLQTTTDNVPGTPGSAPTVAARSRGVLVTITHLANPTGAPLRGYRVEGSTGGIDFVDKDDTTILIGTLVPSMDYKFRYAAVNDNGTGPWSPWSAAVKPLNPDEPGPGRATEVTVENRINPIYGPDGQVKPGTGGTTGPVATLVASSPEAGEVQVDWTAPTWGTPTDYNVFLYDTNGTQVDGDGTSGTTYTFASVDPGTYYVTVTPNNDRGNGIVKTSNTVTVA